MRTIKEISNDYKIFFEYLDNGSNVLFIYPEIEELHHLRELSIKLNIKMTILENRPKNKEEILGIGFNLINEVNIEIALNKLDHKQFDYIILNNTLGKTRFPADIVSLSSKKCHNLLIGQNNYGHWSKRLFFLFYGSHFVKHQNETLKEKWFDGISWLLTSKDMINLCKNIDVIIENAVYISGTQIKNVFDIRNYSNLMAKKCFYLIYQTSLISTPIIDNIV